MHEPQCSRSEPKNRFNKLRVEAHPDGRQQIYLDGHEIRGVIEYNLVSEIRLRTLTITMYVDIESIGEKE